jgi:hypothetical protein
MGKPVRPPLGRIFPASLPAERRHVKEVVRSKQLIKPASVCRIGMKDAVTGPVAREILVTKARLLELRLVPVVRR